MYKWHGNLKGTSPSLLLFNLFEHKKNTELFTSGELEHIPPDVKSNYRKPHELNKEVTRLPCALQLHICHYVCLHLPLCAVWNEQMIAHTVCNHLQIKSAVRLHFYDIIMYIDNNLFFVPDNRIIWAITWHSAVSFLSGDIFVIVLHIKAIQHYITFHFKPKHKRCGGRRHVQK